MAQNLRIKNWKKHQHFKDRNPPWIKLQRDILDRRDISLISDKSFRILINLWLLAAEDESREGNLPSIPDIAYRLRKSEKEIIQALQELKEFVYQDDISVISDRYQHDTPETETETETDICLFEEFYSLYPRKEAKGKAEPAYKKAIKEGATHEEIIRGLKAYNEKIRRESTERKYIALPATWLNGKYWLNEYAGDEKKVSANRQSYDRKAELFS
jgi:hypothetical protein